MLLQTTFQKDLLKDTIAVVTGDTSGISKATAVYPATFGSKVYALILKSKEMTMPSGAGYKIH